MCPNRAQQPREKKYALPWSPKLPCPSRGRLRCEPAEARRRPGIWLLPQEEEPDGSRPSPGRPAARVVAPPFWAHCGMSLSVGLRLRLLAHPRRQVVGVADAGARPSSSSAPFSPVLRWRARPLLKAGAVAPSREGHSAVSLDVAKEELCKEAMYYGRGSLGLAVFSYSFDRAERTFDTASATNRLQFCTAARETEDKKREINCGRR